MCCKGFRGCIRRFDAFQSPISMSYKRQNTYTSVCGGLVTLLIVFGMLGFLTQAVISIFIHPEFDNKETCLNKSYNYLEESVILNMTEYNVAM